ncbi:MAG: hypothetical protein CVT94_13695 [Bacteroidetes bacterium HGW-Bacteroidetes-11]|nr:MAG: hypothetical protein CVT94_13695 [Bacteroidetes bacterium HGW-Bacteroidetes-11]
MKITKHKYLIMTRKFRINFLLILFIYNAYACSIQKAHNHSNIEQDIIELDTSVCFLPFIEVTDERLLETLDLITEESISVSVEDKCDFLTYFTLVTIYYDEKFAGFKVFMHKNRAFLSISDDSNRFAKGFYKNGRLFIIKNMKINSDYPYGSLRDSLISIKHCSSGCFPSYSLGNILFDKEAVTFKIKVEEFPELYFN